MIVYDINSFPSGVDLSVWFDLFEKGLAIYDSKIGNVPFATDDKVALVDINSMANEDLLKVGEVVQELRDEYDKKNMEERLTYLENSKKLIQYLKKINNGQ